MEQEYIELLIYLIYINIFIKKFFFFIIYNLYKTNNKMILYQNNYNLYFYFKKL